MTIAEDLAHLGSDDNHSVATEQPTILPRADWPFKPFDSCAVVGYGHSLAGRGCGEEIDAHQATMADPDLFRSDPARFDATAKAMQAAETALAAAEEQWLELEMKREELESG